MPDDGAAVKGLVSIIIPTYNSSDFVVQAVESCLGQTYRPLEVIVCDDGSEDDTAGRLRPYAEMGSIIYLALEHGERSRARNAGLARARGEYIQLLDSDDLLEKTKIEKQVAFLSDHPRYFGVYCSAVHFGEVERVFERAPRPKTGNITRHIIRGNFILIDTMLTKRSGVYFDESMNRLEDWDYWFRISLGGRLFGFLDEKLCRVRRHKDNSSRDMREMLQSELSALKKMASSGIYPNDFSYSIFERMYALGMEGSWQELAGIVKREPGRALTAGVFLIKHWVRKALGRLRGDRDRGR